MKSGKINGKKNLNAADCGKKKNLIYTLIRKRTEIILTQTSLERQNITPIIMATDSVTFLK